MSEQAEMSVKTAAQLIRRIEIARKLLDDAWNPECMEYDTQGVNQAHRVLHGGEFPREIKEGAK